jgi:hypothetical protein
MIFLFYMMKKKETKEQLIKRLRKVAKTGILLDWNIIKDEI